MRRWDARLPGYPVGSVAGSRGHMWPISNGGSTSGSVCRFGGFGCGFGFGCCFCFGGGFVHFGEEGLGGPPVVDAVHHLGTMVRSVGGTVMALVTVVTAGVAAMMAAVRNTTVAPLITTMRTAVRTAVM